MTSNKAAQLESTLLSLIAHAKANGASRAEISKYEDQLARPKSKAMVEELFSPNGHSSLQKLVDSVKPSR